MPAEVEPRIIVVGFSDLMPEMFIEDNIEMEIEECFDKFIQWKQLHAARFHNNATKVGCLKFILSGTALQKFNDIPAAQMPANINELRDAFYLKFRIAKTRLEWKKELQKCKYVPGSSTLPMLNRFQGICNKLNWPIAVQIEMFVKILPMNLCQFVVSRAHGDFAELALSVKTYQELIEVDTVAHIFKNVSFEDDSYTLCHKPHKSLECPSLRSIIEMEVSSSTMSTDSTSNTSDNRSRSPTSDSRPRRQFIGDRTRSYSRSPNRQERGRQL